MPIPSYRRVDHVGIVVPDLEQAVQFFGEALGGRLLHRGARPNDPVFMVESLQAPADGAYQVAMIQVPPDLNLELFQWTSAERRATMPSIADLDAHHFGLEVSDIDAAVAHLARVEGVELLGSVKQVPDGVPGAGIRFLYFRAPWGLNIELVDRTRWAGGTPAKLWHEGSAVDVQDLPRDAAALRSAEERGRRRYVLRLEHRALNVPDGGVGHHLFHLLPRPVRAGHRRVRYSW
jgi:catechol 2,3-dioxygenase-like lactoylglutathione lyase family enzyme